MREVRLGRKVPQALDPKDVKDQRDHLGHTVALGQQDTVGYQVTLGYLALMA